MAYYAPMQEFGAAQDAGFDALPRSLSESAGASIAEGISEMPTNRATDFLLHQVQGALDTDVAPDELNKTYGIPGVLKFDKPTPASTASDLYQEKRAQALREETMAHGPAGLLAGTANFFAGAIPQFLDPINVGSMFVPGLGNAALSAKMAEIGDHLAGAGLDRMAGAVAGAESPWSSAVGNALVRAGAKNAAIGNALQESRAGRALMGASQGFAGQAALEPLDYMFDRDQHDDWSMSHSLLNLLFGSAIGSLHGLTRPKLGVETPLLSEQAEQPEPVSSATPDAQEQTEAQPQQQTVPTGNLLEINEAQNLRDEMQGWIGQHQRISGEQDQLLDQAAAADQKAGNRAARTEAAQASLHEELGQLRDRHAGVTSEVNDLRDQLSRTFDDTTPDRLEAVHEELAQPDLPGSRRAQLEAERDMLEQGGGSAAERALGRARTEAQIKGLEREQNRLARQIARQEKKAQASPPPAVDTTNTTAFRTGAARIGSRQDVVEQLAARSLRKYAGRIGSSATESDLAGMARSVLTAENPDDVLRQAMESIRNAPWQPGAHLQNLAHAYSVAMGRIPEGMPENAPFRRAMELDPDRRAAAMNEAFAAVSEGRPTVAGELASAIRPGAGEADRRAFTDAAQAATMNPPPAETEAVRDTRARLARADVYANDDGSVEAAQRILDRTNADLGIGTDHSVLPEEAEEHLREIAEMRKDEDGIASACEAAAACMARRL